MFEIAEGAAHFVPSRRAVTKRIGDFDFIQRSIFRLLNESQNLCAQILISCFPFACHGGNVALFLITLPARSSIEVRLPFFHGEELLLRGWFRRHPSRCS